MEVRYATHEDTEAVCLLIARFLTEAPYPTAPLAMDKAAGAVGALVSHQAMGNPRAFAVVMDHGGLLAGMILAERCADIWTDADVVQEHFVYVREPYRGSVAAGRMLLRFKEWAEGAPGMVRAQASSGINDDAAAAIYAKMGWHQRGVIYGTEVS